MEDIKSASLAQIGSYFLDMYDESIRDDDNMDMVEAAAEIVTAEIVRRVGADKIRHLMDFHYKAWADAEEGERMERFYEFKAMTVAFDELKQS